MDDAADALFRDAAGVAAALAAAPASSSPLPDGWARYVGGCYRTVRSGRIFITADVWRAAPVCVAFSRWFDSPIDRIDDLTLEQGADGAWRVSAATNADWLLRRAHAFFPTDFCL